MCYSLQNVSPNWFGLNIQIVLHTQTPNKSSLYSKSTATCIYKSFEILQVLLFENQHIIYLLSTITNFKEILETFTTV